MSRSLVIGGSGLLGQFIVSELRSRGEEVVWTYLSSSRSTAEGALRLDIRDHDAVNELVSKASPDHVYLPAAMTDVDQCERSPGAAWEVNSVGTMSVTKACAQTGAKLLYVSTDQVFSGMKGSRYYEFDGPDPINIYGQTKLEGERCTMDGDRHNLVCRVSVLYCHSTMKKNFVSWLIEELGKGNRVKAFRDQYVSPTYAPHCAGVLVRLMEEGKKGIYHTSGPDCMSRYEMALEVAEAMSLDASLIEPIHMSELGLMAKRPEKACLSVDKAESELDITMVPFRKGIEMTREQVKGVGPL